MMGCSIPNALVILVLTVNVMDRSYRDGFRAQ